MNDHRIHILGIFLAFVMASAFAQTAGQLEGQQVRVSKEIDTSIEAKPLNDLVNTPFIEFGPTLTKDGKRLYFSRQGHPNNTGGPSDEDIWYCEFDDATQSWTEAVNPGAPLNNEGPNWICGVGVNGDTILLGNVYGKKGKMTSGLSLSIKTGNLWSFPQPIHISNNYNLSDRSSFDLSNDRNTLIIAQKKVDSQGGLDLYASFRDPDGKYEYAGTESINLGPIINSHGDETSPFLSYDGITLFFASNGHNGFGGYDIFMSKRLDNTWTNWSTPENLGPGINSYYDDMFFGFTPSSRYAYFSRGLSPSNTDIYRIDMTYLFKNVDRPVATMKTGDNKVEIGQTQTVRHVFDNDKSEINDIAKKDLQYVIDYLSKFEDMLVMIGTHSNIHSKREESAALAIKRAERIKQLLVDAGISAERLSTHHYGHDIVVNVDSIPTSKDVNVKNAIAGSVEFRLIGFTGRKQE